ncbi:Predicted Zn-dependent peptidase [Ekhidna lutea]|uniref:Predicted Zn-dependent peptidase n=1 Tax=Ekhidna lutea TaxID=447679 RepID=A0A239JMZ9_EKHLU|nr:pitrilysin family protein [Ekhidna lutea]SNT06134.1 Predicted Zn-dependent peptidase [Ekhidna lutea]
MSKKEYELIELPNGIRVIHKEVNHTKIAHVGIMLDIGSRDESLEEQGLAHFLEHMVFKGTNKRSSYHIINRLESLGGELNAYTTKEKICFYASLLDIHLDKAVELLCDITFNSTFPEKQIEKERQVILEEMSMYRDTPEDSIQDDFDEQLFPNHALGRNILGTEQTVNSFKQGDFRNFLDRNLNTEKIILSSVGNYSAKKIQRLATKYLEQIPHKNHTPERNWFSGYQPTRKEVKKSISQAHIAMGMPSLSIKDENRIPFFFVVNLLGGPSMSSRLNLSLREKHGLVYGVDASYAPYLEVGQFSIFFATDPKNLKKSQRIILKEIELLKSKPLGNMQLHKAKNQIKGQMALSEENKNATMLMMAKSQLDLNKVPDIDSVFKKIDAITAEDIQALSQRYFPIDQMSSLAYLPE